MLTANWQLTFLVSLCLSVKCSICKSVSDTYDPYLDIAVEIRVSFARIAHYFGDFLFSLLTCFLNVFFFFFFQQAANIVRALELFVKPDVLSGENAYMCAKWVTYPVDQKNTNRSVTEAEGDVSVSSSTGVKRKCQQPNALQYTGHPTY